MNVIEYAHKQGLKLYLPTQSNDLIILRWFLGMCEDRTFLQTFEPSLATLSNFLKFLQFPTNFLYFTSADDEVAYAFWTQPIGQGKAAMGFWSDPNLPKIKLFRLLRASHAYAFNFHSLLLGFTRNEKLLSYINKLGYNVVAELPRAWDGEQDATLVSLVREDYEKGKLRPQRYATRNPGEPTQKAAGIGGN